MKINDLHTWAVSPKEAVRIQFSLAEKIVFSKYTKRIKFVAGVDLSFDKSSNNLFAAVLVLRLPQFEIVESRTCVAQSVFPYIPGLLSFREIPPLITCFEKLSLIPDLIICDGQGYAHPRRLGLACHLGLLLELPTIGCAKSRLVGEAEEPGKERGMRSDLWDKEEKIGYVLRTKTNVKPLYVSAGHLITADDAVRVVLKCTNSYRLPEPKRQAHIVVNKVRKEYPEGTFPG